MFFESEKLIFATVESVRLAPDVFAPVEEALRAEEHVLPVARDDLAGSYVPVWRLR